MTGSAAEPVPTDILAALSRLNEHARANGCGKKAIYAYKTFLAAEFATEARPVMTAAKCHHCGGTGIYRDWDGYEHGQCYRCTKGIATLKFIESTIGAYRWHHPVGSGGHDVLNAVWDIVSCRYPDPGDTIAILADGTERPITFAPADGWGVNMPGAEKLPTDEACRLLNLVEGWIGDAPIGRPANRWTLSRASLEMTRYTISLDRDDDHTCSECGTADVMTYRCGGKSRALNSWAYFSRFMCAACHGPSNAPRWPSSPSPASLTPNVMAWLSHPLRQKPYQSREDRW